MAQTTFTGALYKGRRLETVKQISMLVAELSLATGRPETLIKIDLQDQFQKASKIGELGKAAIKFFRPSRSQKNEPIVVGTRLINSQIVGEVPNQIDVEALEEADRFKNIPGVRVEIHAKDRDKGNTGWAGVVPTVSHRRTKLVLGAGVAPEVLWDSETVWADVVVFYKADKEGNEMPSQIHIQRILDSPNLSAED